MQPESNKFSGAVVRLLKSTGGPYAALVVLLLLCCLSNEHFRNVQNLINITRQVSYSGIIALGMTFVIAGAGIDLSVGSLLALAGAFSIMSMNAFPGSETAAVAVAAVVAVVTGVVKYATYLIAGLTAGISALLFGSRLNAVSSTSAGLSYELDAIAAVIIGGSSMNGGKASVWGTLAGVLILGIVSNVLDMWGISVTLQGTVKGLVIIIAVMIQRKTTA